MLAIIFLLSMFQGKMIMFKPLRFQIILIISSVLHKIAFQFFISVSLLEILRTSVFIYHYCLYLAAHSRLSIWFIG